MMKNCAKYSSDFVGILALIGEGFGFQRSWRSITQNLDDLRGSRKAREERKHIISGKFTTIAKVVVGSSLLLTITIW
jgi:hypothetical protein